GISGLLRTCRWIVMPLPWSSARSCRGRFRDVVGDIDRRIWVFTLDQGVQAVPVGGEQGLDALGADVRDDDVANLVVDVAEQTVGFHLLGLVPVIVGRADVVDTPDLVTGDQEHME